MSSLALPTRSEHQAKARPVRQIGPYELTKTLGQGSMGKVKLAINHETGERRACKIMYAPKCLQALLPNQEPYRIDLSSLSQLPNLYDHYGTDIKSRPKPERKDLDKSVRMLREAALMLVLDHPNVCQLHEIFVFQQFFYFMFEHVSGGQMLDYIISHGKLREKNARKFARQVVDAVTYCHANGIVHRDLKIENILIDETENIKLIDFGLCNFYSTRSFLDTFCGSLYFAAPELLESKSYIGPEVDMWSLGIILYVLVTGKVPFDDANVPKLHQKIKQGQVDYPFHLSSDIKSLIQGLLVVDPAKRLTIDQVRVHPWIAKGGPLLELHPKTLYHHESKYLELLKGFQFKSLQECDQLDNAYRLVVTKLQEDTSSQGSKETVYISASEFVSPVEQLVIPMRRSSIAVPKTAPASPARPRKQSVPDIRFTNNAKQTLDSITEEQKYSSSLPSEQTIHDRMQTRKQSEFEQIFGRADEQVQTSSLKGLFSVTNTSTKTPSEMRRLLMSAMDQLQVEYTEHHGGFSCRHQSDVSKPQEPLFKVFKPFARRGSIPETLSSQDRVYFEIDIVKMPLMQMYGVQFRRIAGDSWLYKKVCQQILTSSRL